MNNDNYGLLKYELTEKLILFFLMKSFIIWYTRKSKYVLISSNNNKLWYFRYITLYVWKITARFKYLLSNSLF